MSDPSELPTTHKKTRSLSFKPVVEQLQQSIESTTHLLEFEMRESNSLNQQIATVEKQLKAIAVVSSAQEAKAIAQLQHHVAKVNKLLNEEKEANARLRETINSYRLEALHTKQSCKEYQQLLHTRSMEAKKQHRLISKSVELNFSQQQQLYSLRMTKATQRAKFTQQLSRLNEVIRGSRTTHGNFQQEPNQVKPVGEPVQILNLLKRIKAVWLGKVESKQQELNDYIAYIKTIHSGFKQIEQLTGVMDYQEIVTGLIKSEDQKYEVVAYINDLNRNIEFVEEANHSIQNKLNLWEDCTHSDMNTGYQRKEALANKLRKQANKTAAVNRKLEAMDTAFAQLAQDIQQWTHLFEPTPLQSCRTQPGTHLTAEETIMQQLAVLEELVEQANACNKYLTESQVKPFVPKKQKPTAYKVIARTLLRDELYTDTDISERKEALGTADFIKKAQEIIRDRNYFKSRSFTPMI